MSITWRHAGERRPLVPTGRRQAATSSCPAATVWRMISRAAAQVYLYTDADGVARIADRGAANMRNRERDLWIGGFLDDPLAALLVGGMITLAGIGACALVVMIAHAIGWWS
jgi:hypothetical protein